MKQAQAPKNNRMRVAKGHKAGWSYRWMALLGALLLSADGWGFVIQGPNPPWQTARLGYAPPAPMWTVGGTGPMQIGEEYRWNVPVLYYSFTGDFLKFFGKLGADEIDRAAKKLNDLPPVSQLNPDDYPTTSMRVNSRAASVNLVDLHSTALSYFLNYIGPGDPSLYVWCLRNRWVTPGPVVNFYVTQRNFDPKTWQPTPFVNGVLWTYTGIFDSDNPPISYTLNAPVVPNNYQAFQSAPVSSWSFSVSLLGGYYNNLTRDDVAALHYIYRSSNVHFEHVTPGGSSTSLANPIAGSGGGGGNPYGLPISGGIGGGIFGNPGVVITNTTSTNLVPTNVVAGAVIDVGIRGGVEKITFQRVDFDGILGAFLTPFSSGHTETVLANGQPVTQTVFRTVTTPEIVWDAGDLQGGDDNGGANPLLAVTTPNYQNNNDINGNLGTANFGPGCFVSTNTPSANVIFNTIGQLLYNSIPGPGSGQANAAFLFPLWGTYDGSTNQPVVYPNRISIEDLEAIVLQGR